MSQYTDEDEMLWTYTNMLGISFLEYIMYQSPMRLHILPFLEKPATRLFLH